MEKNLRICFRTDKSLGIAEDEFGNPDEAYICVKAKNVKSYVIDSESYKQLQEEFKKVVANQLECDIKIITTITLNEYLDNTEDDEN
ncbi:hypothetical protein HF846_15810 [Clostridium cadaveris]|uniref:hypothetical protein n=1 Tax=Clostridium cadaveris TaxID=1529 RepID=UPI00145953D3|nr:hypothetical protein [Clostridium cadaveris]NME66053.1 hypothetical protein [Clostridium cadaveris]